MFFEIMNERFFENGKISGVFICRTPKFGARQQLEILNTKTYANFPNCKLFFKVFSHSTILIYFKLRMNSVIYKKQ